MPSAMFPRTVSQLRNELLGHILVQIDPKGQECGLGSCLVSDVYVVRRSFPVRNDKLRIDVIMVSAAGVIQDAVFDEEELSILIDAGAGKDELHRIWMRAVR